MRVLHFDSGNSEHANIFALLMTAWYYVDPRTGLALIQAGTTPERIENAVDVTQALRGAAQWEGDDKARLPDDGAKIVLRDSAFDMLRESWERYRSTALGPTMAELMQTTDAFLRSVEQVERGDDATASDRQAAAS